MGDEPGSFSRAANGLNHGALSPVSQLPLFTYKKVLLTGKHEGAFCFCFFFFFHCDDSGRLLSKMEYLLNYIKTWVLVYLKTIMLLA